MRRGHEVRWMILAPASTELLRDGEIQIPSAKDAVGYAPDAVYVPGDRVPGFIPGIKVQVMHGITEDKRGNQYPERGLFDLYCTEGPGRTADLSPMQEERGYYRVEETGWVKLDSLLGIQDERPEYDRPQILYASTFSKRLSGAEDLFPEIQRLSQNPEWQWLITLHPKMDPSTVEKYRSLQNDNLAFFRTEHVIELLHRADIMVSDNSSIVQEFMLLEKPAVTYRNRDPDPCMIDISETHELEAAINKALNPGAALAEQLKSYGHTITPWLDGKAAGRILDATEGMIRGGWQDSKPLNLFRNFKMRRQHSYYKFW